MAKKVENKICKLNDVSSQTYGELIMTCVKSFQSIQGQPQGYDYETLKKIKRIDDVIGDDKLKQEYEFEDADFDFVKSKVQSMNSWVVYSNDLIDFITYIVELK